MEGRRELTILREKIVGLGQGRIVGQGTRSWVLPAFDGETLSTLDHSGVITHDVADQVVEVWAGTPVVELQDVLALHGQCLPLAADLPAPISGLHGTVGGLLATNLPHGLTAQCGGPRDWTLGMTVLRTDGTTAKCGSKAVKSVAGYDVHKLFVGSRGTLGVILKVILRTFPIRALPQHSVDVLSNETPAFIARSLRTDFDALRSNACIAVDAASCTVWCKSRPELPTEAWLIGPGGVRSGQDVSKYEESARRVFDPEKRFAPGWCE